MSTQSIFFSCLSKLILSMALVFTLQSNALFSQTTDSSLYGLWKGETAGEFMHMRFDSSGYLYFIMDGDTLGGPSYLMEDVLASMKYQTGLLDSVKTIDITIYDVVTGQLITKSPGIYKFTSNGELMVCVSFETAVRPTEFKMEDSITMRRVK